MLEELIKTSIILAIILIAIWMVGRSFIICARCKEWIYHKEKPEYVHRGKRICKQCYKQTNRIKL